MSLHEVGQNSDLVRVIALGLADLREGSYNFTLRLTDNIFNRTVSRTTKLTLTP